MHIRPDSQTQKTQWKMSIKSGTRLNVSGRPSYDEHTCSFFTVVVGSVKLGVIVGDLYAGDHQVILLI
jgi:hypothetical protein